MHHSFVSNGDTQLVIVPTNETERVLLKNLLASEVDVCPVQDHMTILGQSLNGGIIIRKKQKASEPADLDQLPPDLLKVQVAL